MEKLILRIELTQPAITFLISRFIVFRTWKNDAVFVPLSFSFT